MKTCKTCNYFRRIYDRYSYFYFRRKWYGCMLCRDIVERDSVCDNWRRKGRRNTDVTAERVSETEEDVKFIMEYFNESK